MADEPEAAGGGVDGRKIAAVAGLGAIGVGAYLLTRQAPGSKPAPKPFTGKRLAVATWLSACRPDVVPVLQQARWSDVLGQYLREQWPDFVNRSDVGGNIASLDAQGQWFREAAPSFWNRADIQAAWFGYPPQKSAVIGQFLKENGALNCAGSAPGSVPAPVPVPVPAPVPVRPAPIDNAMLLPPGCIIATDCNARASRAYFVESANPGTGRDRTTVPWSGKNYYRWKRRIVDNQAWLQLGDPWRAIRLVTQGCLDDLANGPDLQSQGSYGWASGPPLNGVINSVAGYCT